MYVVEHTNKQQNHTNHPNSRSSTYQLERGFHTLIRNVSFPLSNRSQPHDFKTCQIGRGFHTLIRNATDVGSHKRPFIFIEWMWIPLVLNMRNRSKCDDEKQNRLNRHSTQDLKHMDYQ